MDVLRTPDERFASLPGFAFEPRYAEVEAGDPSAMTLRMSYVDEGPPASHPVVLLHGEPSWSYLYRKVIPIVVGAGLRAIAPDLVGFGRSDKPAGRDDYTYRGHVEWTRALLFDHLDLSGIVLVGQDWGGLIGLRLVAEHPDRFAGVVASNTGLPTGDQQMPDAFFAWQRYSQETPRFHVGRIVRAGCLGDLPADVVAAYDAPFLDESFTAGARQFPILVPTRPDDPAAPANRAAWDALARFDRPFLTAFSDSDPITGGADRLFRAVIPGAKDQPHTTIRGAGHFLQEDRGEDLAEVIVDFVRRSVDPASDRGA